MKPNPDDDTLDASVNLQQMISATGSYTLTKTTCRGIWNSDDGLVSRLSRSADFEDMSGMARDSILAKMDQGLRCCIHSEYLMKLSSYDLLLNLPHMCLIDQYNNYSIAPVYCILPFCDVQ